MSTVRERNNGSALLIQRLRSRPKVRVGIMAEEGAEPKMVKDANGSVTVANDTVADVAAQHEFGIGVPRRSFIADWADESISDAKRRLRKAADRVLDLKGPGLNAELDRFGLWAVGDIQARMSAGIEPGLSQTTIDRKGSDTPLIDTGQLRSSITHEVDDG